MSQITKSLLLIISFALTSNAFGCSCAYLGKLSVKDLEDYDYIAQVKVVEVYPVHKPDSGFNRSFDINFKMDIEEIQHYKGDRKNELIVHGGNYLSEAWTSCDFGMKENQEWVIFGKNIDGEIMVQPCTRTTNYKAHDGSRDWQHGRGFKQLAFLDSAFSIDKKQDFPESGPDTLFYENGNPERVLHFKKGERNGTVTYFFPNGKIYGQGSYKKGKLDGDFNWLYRDGKLLLESSYKNGYKVGKSIYYTPTPGSTNQPSSISQFNKKGEVIRYQDFAPGENGWYISTEYFIDPKRHIQETRFFYESGKLRSIEILKRGKQIEYKEFPNEDGSDEFEIEPKQQ